MAQHCKTIKGYILMCDRDRMPAQSGIPNLMCYEDLIDSNSDDYEWPLFDENSASSLCYTSGTTGNPKGALYSHRSTLLHSYASTMPDALNVSGPLLFVLGMCAQLALRVAAREVPWWSPALFFAGFLAISIDLDLLPFAALAILAAFVPVAVNSRARTAEDRAPETVH